MSEPIYKVDCDPKCGFSVKSHDRNEVVHRTMRAAAGRG